MPRWSTIVLSLAVASVSACYHDDSLSGPPESALARVLLTDAPFPYDSVASVDIYVVRIDASATFDTSGGRWTLITAPRRRFNLLSLQQGITALLGEGPLEIGEYRAVRMVINTDSSTIRWISGVDAQVNWQNHSGSEEMALHALVEAPLTVVFPTAPAQSVGAEFVIDFDVGRSFLFDFFGTREFTFLPWIRVVHATTTGSIDGFVTSTHTGASAPIRNANVTVFPGDSILPPELRTVAATGRTDASGHYRVAFLRAGAYIVRIEQPESPFLAAVETPGILVRAGAVAQHSVTLPEAGGGGAYIQISGPSSVGVGGTIAFQVAVGDANGDPVINPSVTWSVSDTGVVALQSSDTTAYVRGKRPGSSRVIASSGGMSDTASVQVIGSTAPVATVTLSPSARTLVASDSGQSYGSFTATLRDSLGNQLVNRAISWSTSDSTIARIVWVYEAQITVRGLRAGTATVRAISEGRTGQAGVTVNP